MDLHQFFQKQRNLRRERLDADKCDKWHNEYLATTFFIVAILCQVNQLVGNRMSCAIPLHIPGSYSGYIMNICWLNNTYYFPFNESLGSKNQYASHKIRYYAIIPLILTLAGGLTLLPSIFYRSFAKRTGIDLSMIIKAIKNAEIAIQAAPGPDLNKNEQMRQIIFNNIARSLNFNRRKINSHKILNMGKSRLLLKAQFWTRKGNFFTKIFLMKKFLSVVTSLIIMQSFQRIFGHFWFMGIDFALRMFKHLAHGHYYQNSHVFPLYSVCDVKFPSIYGREKGQAYSFECVMTRNIFFDLFFTFIWFILVSSLILDILNFFNWCNLLCGYKTKMEMISKVIDDSILSSQNQKIRSSVSPVQSNTHISLSSLKNHSPSKSEIIGDIINSNPEIGKRKEMWRSSLEKILTYDALLCALFIFHNTKMKDENLRTLITHLYITKDKGIARDINPHIKDEYSLSPVTVEKNQNGELSIKSLEVGKKESIQILSNLGRVCSSDSLASSSSQFPYDNA